MKRILLLLSKIKDLLMGSNHSNRKLFKLINASSEISHQNSRAKNRIMESELSFPCNHQAHLQFKV